LSNSDPKKIDLSDYLGNRQYIVDTLNSLENQPPTLSTIEKLRLIKDSFVGLVSLFFTSKKKVSIFSTGGDWQNAMTEKNQSVNRFLHPIFEENKDQDHVYAQYSDKKTFTTNNVTFLKLLALVRVFRLNSKFSNKHFTNYLNKNREFQDFKMELTEKSKIDFDKLLLQSLISNLSEFFVYRRAYRKLLDKYVPEVCLFSGYDKIQNYALIHEANHRSIPTVDVQHGLTGKLHIGYSQFLNIPDSGYNILPSMFWSWDNESKDIINSWAVNTDTVKSFVGGNPWLSYTSKQQLDVKLPNDKKKILVTLQHNGIPDLIYEAIQNSPPDYYWILRIHPRFASVKPDLEQKLKKQIASGNVLVHNAIEIVLPPLLKEIDVHVTQFSSTVLEASYLGVPSVVIELDFIDVATGVDRLKQAIFMHSKEVKNAV